MVFSKLGVEEAEAALLASVLSSPETMNEVSGWLPYPECFWKKIHRSIWMAVNAVYNEGLPIEPAIVFERVRLIDPTVRYDYIDYLMSLPGEAVDISAAVYYARIVYRNYLRREAVALSRKFVDVSSLTEDDIEGLLIQQSRYIEELLSLGPTRTCDIGTLLDRAVSEMNDGSRIIRFNLPFLDEFAGGATRGELVTIGGRPGAGKSLLALNILDSLAKQGLRVMMFNREMTNTMSLSRLIVMNSEKLRSEHLRLNEKPDWVNEEIKRVSEQLKETYRNVIMYDDIADLSGAIREIRRHKPDVFIDDYIQLVRVESHRNDRRFEIEHLMQEYKWIAKKTGSVGILLSQLNRDIDKREDKRPTLGDYAESSTIEQLAELCVFINYPYHYKPRVSNRFETEIIVLKARYGRIGGFSIGYNGARNRFYQSIREAMDDDKPLEQADGTA